jgi:Ras-related protein Rab-1A
MNVVPDYVFNLLLIGNSDVGKSCLLFRYADNIFTEYSGLGINYRTKTISLSGKIINLQIWDTPGVDRCSAMIEPFYKAAHGVIIVYDITKLESYFTINHWLQEVDHNASSNVSKLLVGNKCDLMDKRVFTYSTGKVFANEMGIKYYETSAKEDINVHEAFLIIVADIKARIDSEDAALAKQMASKITYFNCSLL